MLFEMKKITRRLSIKVIRCIPAFIVVLFCFVSFSIDAQAQLCAREDGNPQIIFKSTLSTLEYVREDSSDELSQKHSGMAVSDVLGLAGGNLDMTLSLEMSGVAQNRGKNLYCIQIKKVFADFIANPVIYIASNFARGSCEYNAVLKHEELHIDILERAHDEGKGRARDALYEIIRERSALPYVSLGALDKQKNMIMHDIRAKLDVVMHELQQDLFEKQREIDTYQSYATILSQCKGWEKKLNE